MEQNIIYIPLRWDKIDTSLVKNISDELLLEQVKNVEIYSGWGLVAEICKRFAKRTQKSEE